MQTTVQETDKHKVKLTVEIPTDRFGKDLDAAYRRMAQQVKVPGFRKGKAPRKVIDAQVGLVGRMVQRFARRIGATPGVVVSGGDAEPLVQRLNAAGIAASIAHNLVLAGLALRARDLPAVTER